MQGHLLGWILILNFCLTITFAADCSLVERCSCVNSSGTLLCTTSSCKTVFTNTSSTSYNHLVFVADYGCRPCWPSCRICSSETSCQQCESEYYLQNGACLPCPIVNCASCDNSSCLLCLTGYYLDSTSGLCVACPISGTLSCPSASSISSCQSSYYLSNDGANCIQCDPNCRVCVSTTQCGTCNQGYYLSSFKCAACLSTCLTCASGSTCTGCTQGFYLASNGSCQACSAKYSNCNLCNSTGCSRCSSGYYLASSTSCAAVTSVISFCSVYSNSTTCSNCSVGYFLKGNLCYYGCSNLCTGCSGPHFGLCTACISTASFFNLNCLPSVSINSGLQYQMFLSARNDAANFTPTSSVYCLESSIGFSSTVSFTLSNLGGYQALLQWKTYIFNISTTSSSYSVILANTIGNFTYTSSVLPGSDICSSISNKQAVDKASNKFTQISQTNTITFSASIFNLVSVSEVLITVSRCGGLYGTNCLACSSFNNCTACKDPSYYLLKEDCVQKCPSKYYTYEALKSCYQSCPRGSYNVNSNLTCQACPIGCDTCSSATICLTCSVRFFLNPETESCVATCPRRYFGNNVSRACEPCTYPCLTCNSSQVCLSCYYGFLAPDYSCLTNCPVNYYGDLSNNTCVTCASTTYHCKSCLNTPSVCLSCDQVQPLLLNYACYSTCPDGYYAGTNQCLVCNSQCKTCSISPSKCTSCSYGYLYNFTCSSCPEGYYSRAFDLTCQPCATGCKTCSGNSSYCQSCTAPYLYYRSISSCVTACPNRTFNSSTDCLSCVLPCITCLSATQCLTCSGLFLHNYTCLQAEKCPNNTYASTVTFKCEVCAGCATCSNSQYCTTCNSGLLIANGSCVTSCPATFYKASSTECTICPSPCLACTNETACLSCRTGYYFVPLVSYCTTYCSTGFYLDQNSSCLQCPSSCTSCLNSTFCLTCSVSYYLNPAVQGVRLCSSTCPDTYFPSNSTCQKCVSPCLTCLELLRCLTCDPQYGIQYEYSCITSCIAGTYNDSASLSCKICATPCLTCISSPSTCTTCIQGLFLQGNTCVNSCGSGFFLKSESSSCELCSTSCLTCSMSESNCTSCSTGFLFNRQCIASCPQGMYEGQTNACFNCISPCLTCVNSTSCSACINNYYLDKNNMKCVSVCGDGFYPQTALKICTACVYPCKTCMNYLSCLSCVQGYLYGSQCLANCPTGTFENNAISSCDSCSSNCSTCTNSTFCLSCSNSSLYFFNGSCISTCPDGYFNEQIIMECKVCIQGCLICKDSTTCLSCNVGYLFEQQCVNQCPLGYVPINHTCMACQSNCLTCVVSQNICLSCKAGYLLYLQTCVTICPKSSFAYPYNQTCLPCRAPCATCSDAFSCDSCRYGFILYRGVQANQCVLGPYCPNSYFLNMDSNQCVLQSECPSTFLLEYTYKTCSSTCPDSFVEYRENNTCLQFCPIGYWVDAFLKCKLQDSNTPTLLYMDCRVHIPRNILVVYCSLSETSTELLTLTAENITFSVDGNFTIHRKTSSQIQIIYFPTVEILRDRLVKIWLNKTYGLRGTQNIPIQNNPQFVKIGQYESYDNQQRDAGMLMYSISSSLSQAAFIFWAAGLIRNRGMETIHLLDMLQMFYVLCFIDIYYPPNIGQFLEGFKASAFELLPKAHFAEKNQGCLEKFYLVTDGVSFINNIGPSLWILLAFLSFFLILHLISCITSTSENEDMLKINKKARYLLQRFRFDYVNDVLYVTVTNMLLFGLAQMTFIKSQFSYFSAALGIFCLAVYTVLVIYSTYQLYCQTPGLILRYEFCFRGIKDSVPMGIFHTSFLYLEKFVRIAVVVFSYDSPGYVIAALVLLSLIKLLFYCHLPFSTMVTNYLTILLQILWIMLHCSNALFLLSSLNPLQKYLVGWISVAIIIIMILIGFIFSSAQVLKFEWFEYQDLRNSSYLQQARRSMLPKNQPDEILQNNNNQENKTEDNEEGVMHKIRTFFSEAEFNSEISDNSEQLNKVKKGFDFESEESAIGNEKTPQILIKCIKNGYLDELPEAQSEVDSGIMDRGVGGDFKE